MLTQFTRSEEDTYEDELEDTLPIGYTWYETVILLRPDLDEEKRDLELAKFEAYLQKKNAVEIDVLVRGNSQALAYPIKGFWDGIYVMYTYAATASTVRGVSKTLAASNSGGQYVVLRHMTTKQ